MPLTTHQKWLYVDPLHNKCPWEASHIEDLDEIEWGERKGKTQYRGRQLRLQEVAEVRFLFFFSCFFSSLTHWMETLEGIHEQSVLGRSEKRDSDLQFMNSAFISSPIGLANKLVQFKKRPLYSCSLKAAYTQKKPYEKNLWYQEFQNTKNFTLTLKSILLYIHKRGLKIKTTEKEKVLEIWPLQGGTSCLMFSSELLACCGETSAILVSTFLSSSLKTQRAEGFQHIFTFIWSITGRPDMGEINVDLRPLHPERVATWNSEFFRCELVA